MARKTRKEENAIRKERYRALAARLLAIEIRVGNNLPITAEERRLLNIRIERRRRELLRVQNIRRNRRNQRSVSGNQNNQPVSATTTNTSLVETNRNDVQSHPQASVRRSARNQRATLPNINQPIPERTTRTSTARSNTIDPPSSSGRQNQRNQSINTSTVLIQQSVSQSPTNPSSSIQRRRSNRINQSTDSSTTQISNSLTNTSTVLNQASTAQSPTNSSSSIQRRRSTRRRSNRTNQSTDSPTTQLSNSLSSTVARTPSSNLRIDNNDNFSNATFYVGERITVLCGYHYDQPYTGTIQSINFDNRTADILFDTGPRREYTRSFIHMSHIDLDAGRPVRNNRLQIDQYNFETYTTVPRRSARNRTLLSTSSLSEPTNNSAAPNVDEMDYTQTLEYFGDGSENSSARRLLSKSDVDLLSDVITDVFANFSSEDRKCSICQSEEWSVGQRRTFLPCCHQSLHYDCVLDWLTKHSSNCPLCRFSLWELLEVSDNE
jgi:hypothetical protein